MAIITTDSKHYSNIADQIRVATNSDAEFYPAEMSERIAEVYEGGIRAEYNRFWDVYQSYGTRKNYMSAFSLSGWTDEIFKPKYDMFPTNAQSMFNSTGIVDLRGILKSSGITFSTSNITNSTGILQMFQAAKTQYIPELDCSDSPNTSYAFQASAVVEIDKIITTETTNWANTAFQNVSTLRHVIFEGQIGKNINIQSSRSLDVESMKSIISCLVNYSGTENAFSYAVKFHADCWTRLEADSTAPDGGTWQEYVTMLGWNV